MEVVEVVGVVGLPEEDLEEPDLEEKGAFLAAVEARVTRFTSGGGGIASKSSADLGLAVVVESGVGTSVGLSSASLFLPRIRALPAFLATS